MAPSRYAPSMTYYVQIPCLVMGGRSSPMPASTDSWLTVPVQAVTREQARERVEKALIALVQPQESTRDIDIDDGC